MKPAYPTLLAIVVLLIASACDSTNDANTQSASQATAEPEPVGPPTFSDLPHGTGTPEAFPVAPGSYISGEFAVPQAGELIGLAVEIGNYDNTADGNLAVSVCQGDVCTTGVHPLEGSEDNQYLRIELNPRLHVSLKDVVTYRLVKDGGATPVALWLYSSGTLAGVTINDQSKIDRSPKLAVQYAN